MSLDVYNPFAHAARSHCTYIVYDLCLFDIHECYYIHVYYQKGYGEVHESA